MADKLRILLADDHHVVRGGLRALIDDQDDMEVVAEAADGEAACRLATEIGPDVAILDVSMPILGGARAAECIRRECPGVMILALTIHEDRGYLEQLLKAGASGYMLKRAAVADLIQAIRTVARGDNYLDPAMTSLVIGGLGGRATGSTVAKGFALSDREEEVLRLVARGHTNREIAAQLDISVKTVETYKARAMEKLGLDSRAGIVAHAIRVGWMVEG
jgi:DNA-binding NarL/FixJ family response regulator